MKTWTEQMILDLIQRADNKVLFKMLHSLYERQTAHEQSAEYTRDRNDVGFNAYDAKFLSSVAKNGERYGQVSNGQAPYVRKALKRYRKQLADIANNNEQKRVLLEYDAAHRGRAAVAVGNDFAKADNDARDKKPWGGTFESTMYTMDKKIDETSAIVAQVMDDNKRMNNDADTAKALDVVERDFPLSNFPKQGDLYAKSWDEIFPVAPTKKEEK